MLHLQIGDVPAPGPPKTKITVTSFLSNATPSDSGTTGLDAAAAATVSLVTTAGVSVGAGTGAAAVVVAGVELLEASPAVTVGSGLSLPKTCLILSSTGIFTTRISVDVTRELVMAMQVCNMVYGRAIRWMVYDGWEWVDGGNINKATDGLARACFSRSKDATVSLWGFRCFKSGQIDAGIAVLSGAPFKSRYIDSHHHAGHA